MYGKILAAVNEFTNSEIAARYAVTLARSTRAKLFLVFIAEEIENREKSRHARTALERLFIEADRSGIEAETIIESGDPVKKILGLAKEHSIDIVFTASRRKDIEKRFFTRTVAKQLMLKLPCSVAMVRVVRMGGIHLKNILVPLRGRIAHLQEHAYFTAKLAEGTEAKVTLFHLQEPITSFFHGEVLLTPVERDRYVPKDLEEFRSYLAGFRIGHEKRSGQGMAARAITIEAAQKRNDLIVMGASERALLTSLMKGDPVEEVLRETPCNMIIFRGRKS